MTALAEVIRAPFHGQILKQFFYKLYLLPSKCKGEVRMYMYSMYISENINIQKVEILSQRNRATLHII